MILGLAADSGASPGDVHIVKHYTLQDSERNTQNTNWECVFVCFFPNKWGLLKLIWLMSWAWLAGWKEKNQSKAF